MTDDDPSSRVRHIYASKLSDLRRKDKRNPNRDLLAEQFKSEFNNAEEFMKWWFEQSKKQNNSCYYCDTPIETIRQLIAEHKLRTRNNRSKRDEATGRSINCRGGARVGGERERNPDKGYSRNNCVLACMYCNNDKSDIFEAGAL